MMIRTGMHSEANVMTSKIAGLFRKFLEYDNSQLVAVAEEMSLVKDYLDVESLRFRDKLSVSIEVDENARKMPIPNLILQPLIENAFKHGAAQTLGVFTIEILVKVDRELRITVINDGILHSDMKEGIGISNIRSRLALLYGDMATFTILAVDRKVIAEINLPVK
jgi:LytS/YehU family sensor histidine kinase